MIPSASALLFLHAHTGLHPGTGQALGTVDMPVQRERHTHWPLIPASTLKGVLRDTLRPLDGAIEDGKQMDRARWLAVFGPETANAGEHAGALAVTDARILAFPVRSARGVFVWATCKAVLDRLRRDLKLSVGDSLPPVPPVEPGTALVPRGAGLLADGEQLLLEEYDFSDAGDSTGFGNWLAEMQVVDDGTGKRLRERLVVLPDDDFGEFTRHATEVVARIKLDYETKTVQDGALFYEEFLPPETLFYAMLLATPSRKKELTIPAVEVIAGVARAMGEAKYLQIGGNASIGKGICAVRVQLGRSTAAGR